MLHSGVTGRGHSAPLTFFTGKFLLTNREKRSKENRENGRENENWKEEGICKLEGEKVRK